MTMHQRYFGTLPGASETIGQRLQKQVQYACLPKRAFDICFVLLAAPFALPLIGLLLLLAASDGHSPIYRQRRVGRDGRIYDLFKIRTMVPDADAHLERYIAANPAARLEWEKHQKLRHDPRVTWIGWFLRKFSLDELPQLWNVLIGDMSLVGPRPMMVEQRTIYPGRAYFLLRPGITGSWQVSDRNHSAFVDRAHFDDAYWSSLSLSTDLKILWKTFGVVARGTGC